MADSKRIAIHAIAVLVALSLCAPGMEARRSFDTIALDNHDAADNFPTGVTNPVTLTYTVGVAGNMVMWANVAGTSAAPTFDGVALTQVQSVNNGIGYTTYSFCLVAPHAGAHTLSTGTAAGGSYVQVATYSGAAQTCTPDSSSTASGAVTVSTTTVADNAWTIMGSVGSGASAPNAGAGTTKRDSFTSGGFLGAGLFDSNGAITPPGSTSLTETGSGGADAVWIVSIAPGTISGVSIPPIFSPVCCEPHRVH